MVENGDESTLQFGPNGLIPCDCVWIVIVGSDDSVDLEFVRKSGNEVNWIAVKGYEAAGFTLNFFERLVDKMEAAVVFVGKLIEDICVVDESDVDGFVGCSRLGKGGVVTEPEVAAKPNEGGFGHDGIYEMNRSNVMT